MRRLLAALPLGAALLFGGDAFAQDPGAKPAPPKQAEDAKPAKAEKKQIDVVFVIDTTGSMRNLIEGAKRKVWSIVNELASGKPTPQIRCGLVAYRDKHEDYITQVTDLTADLDAVYTKLRAFSAKGGGDMPEHVNRGLHDAVHKIKWSESKKALKIIFLVGDAPAHTDYDNDVQYGETCVAAIKKGIVINTVRCGNNPHCARHWKDIADRAEGTFVTISQGGGMVAVKTPFDERLAALQRKLDGGRMAFGRRDFRERSRGEAEKELKKLAEADGESKAARASYKAKAGAVAKPTADAVESLARGRGGDLLAAYKADPEKVLSMDADKLPEDLGKLDKGARKAELDKRLAAREAIQAELLKLSKQRDEHIKAQRKAAGSKRDAFDQKVIEAIKKQAAKKGITYE